MNVLGFLVKIPVFLLFFRSGRKILAAAAMIIVLAILFSNLGPQSFEMSPLQRKIGDELVEKAVEQFPWNRQVGSVMMIADVEAWSPFFQDAIRERVTNYKSDGSRKFDILPDAFTTRVMKTMGFKTNPGRLSDAEVDEVVRTMEADTLLLVRFTGRDYIEDADSVSGHLSCTFYGRRGVEPIRISVSAEHEKSTGMTGRIAHYFKTKSTAMKLVWGVIGVLLFPFLMAPVTLTVVRLQSAKINALMIFVYALFIYVAEGLVFSAPKGVLQGLLMCAWAVAILWYLLRTCDMLASPGFRRRMQTRLRS